MKTEILPADHPQATQKSLDAVHRGLPVAFPTDTVYGVGCLAFDAAGIERLYALKERDPRKAIPVLLSSPDQLPLVVDGMNLVASLLANRFWPGPLTLVVSRNPNLPANISPTDTIGVRMPDHPVALALLEQTGPMAVSSANLSGQEPASTAQQAAEQLHGRVVLIIDGGKAPGGAPSTVVDCTGEDLHILRQGPVTREALEGALRD